MKNCNKCNQVKSYEFFYKNKSYKDGYQTTCKSCMVQTTKKYYLKNKDYCKEKQKEYRLNNKKYRKDYLKEYAKEYNKKNKEKLKEYQKQYRIKNKNYAKEYFKDNKEKIKKYQNEYKKNRLQNDNIFKFGFNLRCLIRGSFKRNNNKFKKNTKTENILGCTVEEFKNYILTKFTKKMTFENYGKWHLDHIIPISSAQTEEEVIRLNHYTNFQPMWAKENISKGNKIIEKQLTLL
jgi:hypothetical protein